MNQLNILNFLGVWLVRLKVDLIRVDSVSEKSKIHIYTYVYIINICMFYQTS